MAELNPPRLPPPLLVSGWRRVLYKLLGLYLDQKDGDSIVMQQPKTDIDAATGRLARRPEPPTPHPTRLFEVGDEAFYGKLQEYRGLSAIVAYAIVID